MPTKFSAKGGNTQFDYEWEQMFIEIGTWGKELTSEKNSDETLSGNDYISQAEFDAFWNEVDETLHIFQSKS